MDPQQWDNMSMGKKAFRVPPECKALNNYYWGLKQAAQNELKKNGIDTEPSQAPLKLMQKICDENPYGALTMYVCQLKKGYRMSDEELLAFDREIQELKKPIKANDPLDFQTESNEEYDDNSSLTDSDFDFADELGDGEDSFEDGEDSFELDNDSKEEYTF